MSKVDVNLADSGTESAIFHNLRYTNDHYGGNQNEMTFEIRNWSGNMIHAEAAIYATNQTTGKTELSWGPRLEEYDAIRITIRGACENDEFLRMLQLILEAEKMVSVVKP